ncbi:major facilitator superfamily domain-containing protein [Roridomyces roridus]|uniref:Major facilitator superfamily domain-containing protein n=1 Tax=Roridomyces roridus TaxID=1738132 RepID=A0AAD7C9Q1_9AGAR|nr:major facilitator superfamily domain-containing protein [Roridomyces roridus]
MSSVKTETSPVIPTEELHSTSKPESHLDSQDESTIPRDWKFWCIILSLAICLVLTAMELSAVGTALPVIVQDLKGDQFVWVGSAYTLGCTALIPFCGGLAQIFGRRIVVLVSIALFCIATHMNFLIGGRTVQGLGSGAITALIQIIIADLVPLKERGSFNGIMALAWALGGGSGPVIGGSLAQRGKWRWLFYLNIPVAGLAATLVTIFLRLKKPNAPLREKLKKIDWIGTFIIVAATTSIVIALTWAGIQFSWSSAKVLVPLILGILGLFGFLAFEALGPEFPIVPISLLGSRTALSGYAQNFFNGLVISAVSCQHSHHLLNWLPVYFQACKDAGPTAGGVDVFGLSYTISPSALLIGIVIQKTLRYRQPMWCGWALMIVGSALLGTIDENSSRSMCYGFEALVGIGMGFVYISAYFPVLAPIPVSQAAPALAFFTFLRNFALIWGITIGGTVVQNQLIHRLPSAFLAQFPGGTQIAFEIIPSIKSLPQPLKDQVRHAFAGSLQVLWNVIAGVSGLGLLISLAMKHLPLHTSVDSNWGTEKVEKDVQVAA